MTKNNYEDIIDMPHHTSSKHPRMTIEARSAQFAPFSALTGYNEAVKETARVTEEKIEIDDGLKIVINNKLQIINNNIKDNPKVSITYFIKDKNKEGGKYITIRGTIKKLDSIKELVILEDKTIIPIKDIINITSSLFSSLEWNK